MYKCKDCRKNFTGIVVKGKRRIRRYCDYCKKLQELITKGFYYTKARPHLRKKFRCRVCNHGVAYHRTFHRSTTDHKILRKMYKLFNHPIKLTDIEIRHKLRKRVSVYNIGVRRRKFENQ